MTHEQRMTELHAQGRTFAEIADALGGFTPEPPAKRWTGWLVWRELHERGLSNPPPSPVLDPPAVARAIELYEPGTPWKVPAETLAREGYRREDGQRYSAQEIRDALANLGVHVPTQRRVQIPAEAVDRMLTLNEIASDADAVRSGSASRSAWVADKLNAEGYSRQDGSPFTAEIVYKALRSRGKRVTERALEAQVTADFNDWIIETGEVPGES